ncbi:hypothetical protein QL285_012242 [Trifolium repens]|nr:hypothetical protein QL285_012242 [Trifolium repens]
MPLNTMRTKNKESSNYKIGNGITKKNKNLWGKPKLAQIAKVLLTLYKSSENSLKFSWIKGLLLINFIIFYILHISIRVTK